MLPVSPREITMPFLILLIFLQLHFIHPLTLSEYNALLAIKSVITDDPQDFLSSWNSTTHHCTWPGVGCCNFQSQNFFWPCYSSIPNGSVVSLDLSRHNLTGSLSPDIGFLTYLRYLSAGSNRLSGPLPSSIYLLSSLQSIDLSYNNFNGAIPEFIGDLPELEELYLAENNLRGSMPQKLGTNGKLERLDLSENKLTGKLPESLGGCQSLNYINVAHNFLSGSIPKALFGLPKLQVLRLEDNRFSGSIPEAQDMDLSNKELSGRIPPSIGNFSAFGYWYLDGDSFTGSIPPEIADLQQLQVIDLSRNNFTGQIPPQIKNSKMFRYLNLSRNQLSGCITELPGKVVDISYNVLQGALPVFSSHHVVFFASNNRFNGPIDPSICNSNLSSLDLSNNKLVGQIPSCLASSFKGLQVLNLQHNNLSGSIPAKFSRCDNLMDLDLSFNQLEGIVPRSLAQCNNLEVVNLGSNRLNDTFPHWLDTLPKLQALILHFNYFHGPLIVRSHSKDSFSKLRMLDLSNNHFSGTLPSKLIENMKGMMSVGEGEERSSQEYLHGSYFFKYFLVSVRVKGLDLEIRILNTLTTIDFSCNMFQGDIPTSIGDLKALRWLNLSHNNFTNRIPSTIGSLKVLESLDLSCNNLRGEIPREIEKLTSLAVFNVSQNQLVGPIPWSTQLSTFNNDSYLQNPGLCGSPLSKNCTNEDAPQHLPPISVNPPNTEWGSNIHLWEVILMGCAVGWAVGVISGYFMLSSRKPLWLSRWAYQLEYRVLKRSKRRTREHQMRAGRN